MPLSTPAASGRTPGVRPRLARAWIVLLTLAAVAPVTRAQGSADDAQLPQTLRQGYVGPVIGPADDTAYARGSLGLVRSSFGRASLYVAWRVIHLPPGALARESHARRGSWLQGGPFPPAGADELAGWLAAREAVVQAAPAVPPDYYRVQRQTLPGGVHFDTQEGQCGPDAFAFATRTLQSLREDRQLRDEDRRHWVTAQDAVFARCSWTPAGAPPPPLPAEPPPGAAPRLQALHEYQRASALFYGDDYAGARQAFDAIAARPDHPMRPWAALGGMRAVLREVTRDREWSSAIEEAWTRRGLRGAEFGAAIAQPRQRRQARIDAAMKALDARFKAAIADPALAPVHRAMAYTGRRALMQLLPAVPLRQAMDALGKPESNPYTMGTLDLFQELYPAVAPDRPEGNLAAALRRHEWFDFIQVVQACAGGPGAAEAALCDREHAHAAQRWQHGGDPAWLLATLLTVRQPGEAHRPAAQAARAVASTRPEWASLQFHAARVLGSLGQKADARAALEAVAASGQVHRRDRVLVEEALRGL